MRRALRRVAVLLGAVVLAAGTARGDEIALPAPALDRTGPVVALWRPAVPAAGRLTVAWTDTAGRVVERYAVEVADDAREVAVPLDLRRAVVPDNRLSARFAPREGAERTAEAAFTARPAPGWPGYPVLMWQAQTAAALAALRDLGVTGTKVTDPLSAEGAVEEQRAVAVGMRFYTENIATDFYASYHRWTPGRRESWRFDAARAQHAAAPGDLAPFAREPSLSDPAWLDTVAARVADIAWRLAPYRPLFHNLGDESGIGDLAANWDFDLSAPSLDAMRDWLRRRYGTLDALNAAWGAHFADWADVRPALTDDAVRDDAAVPAWMDFKAWMDVAFARAVRVGTDAVRRGDPHALAALEGAQVPGWGGYDYGRLAGAVDVMEIYDAGNAVEIARSLNPRLRVLTTSFEGGAAERHRLWHEWLLGGAGAVIWDDAHTVVGEDGTPQPRGLEMAPLFRELGGALGALFLDAKPEPGRVAILYSQASFRVRWLLDRRAEAAPWTARDAEAEFTDDNAWRHADGRAAAALAGLGAQPRWITPETLAAGALGADGTRVLVLPQSLALSDAEVAAVRGFAAGGGLVLADVSPGERDALGRPRAAPPLGDLVQSGRLRFPAALRADGGGLAELAGLLDEAGASPPVRLLGADGAPAAGVALHLFRSGGVLLAGIERLAGDAGEEVTLRLPGPLWVQALRGGAAPGRADRASLRVGAVDPVLLALSPDPIPAVALTGPASASRGDLVAFRVAPAGRTPAAAHLVGVTVTDPSGRAVPLLAETVRVPPEGATWRLRLAVSDAPGVWRVRAADAFGGEPTEVAVEVR
jgi:hypothetical protein